MSYNDKAHVTMEPRTRKMVIPTETKFIGVVGDNEGERVNIDIPRWYDGIDLGTKRLYIVVSNDGDPEQSDMIIPDIQMDDETIHLTWVVLGKHVSSEGSVYAHVMAKDENGFKWQSLDGEYEVRSVNDGPDQMPEPQITAVEQTLAEMDEAKTQTLRAAAQALSAATVTAPPIIPTEEGEAIELSDSAERPLRALTIYGRTVQNGTPTPDAPIALESVGADGHVKVSSGGKNLYNPDMLVFGKPFYNSDGTTQSASSTRVGLIPVEPNTEYTVTAYGSGYIRMAQLDANKVYIRRNILNGNEEGASITITTAANAAYMQVASDRSISKAQIEKGSAATEYEQDEPKTTAITTENGILGVPVTSGGNYTDENGQQWIADTRKYDADTGTGKQVQWIEPIDFDGSEDYQALNGYFRVLHPGLKAGGSGLCTIAPVYNAFSQNGFYYNATYIYFRFDDAGINSEKMTVAEVKAWVAENPFTLYAILAEPVETDLPAEEIASIAALKTHYPNTTIYNSDGAHMAVEYIADTKLYIDNAVSAAITAAMTLNK